MERERLHGLLDGATSADLRGAGLATLAATIAAARRLKAVLGARVMTAAAEMDLHSAFPEKKVAEAAMVSLAEAGQIVARSHTTTEIPALAEACERGEVTARHVDVFAKVLKNVSAPVANRLRADAARLVAQAATMSWEEFGRLLRREAERFEPAGDDDARLERQRGRCGCGRSPTVSGWDAGSRIGIRRRSPISSTGWMSASKRCSMTARPSIARTIRSNANSSCAPTRWSIWSPRAAWSRPARGSWLCAAATTVSCASTGVAAASICPTPSWLAELARCATIFDVTVQDGDIVSAPGQLNLGRTTRLANRHQRRALAAVHATCAIPGCEVSYWRTKLHHVTWWRNGGTTDLENLLPLCAQHHTCVHTENWGIKLAPARIVTITLPEGTTLDHPPP